MVLNGGTVTIALENMDIDAISILLSHLVAEIWVKECFSLMAATALRRGSVFETSPHLKIRRKP